MSLLVASGLEGGSINPWTAAQFVEELGTGVPVGTIMTVQSSGQRSGDFCWRAAANAQSQIRINKGRTDGRHYWLGAAFKFGTNFPSALTTIISNQFVFIRVTTGGNIQMESPAGTIIGSATALSLDTWYYCELQSMIRAAAAEEIHFWLDGVEKGSSTAELTSTLSTNFDVGPLIAYGASRTIDIDDIYMTDDQGSSPFNSRLGPVSVYTSLPISDVGGGSANWKKGDGSTTTNKWSAIDNRPPAGEATAGTTVESQLEDAVSSASDNQSFNMESLNTAGVPSGHEILATRVMAITSASSTTGTTDGSLEILATDGHPAVTEASQDWVPTAAAGTYPTGWHRRTLPISDAFTLQPSITDRSVSPQIEIGKRIANTRVLAICQLRLDILTRQPAATTYEETGSMISGTVMSGADVAERTEAGVIFPSALLAGVDSGDALKTGTISPDTLLAGLPVFTASVTGSLVTDADLTGASQKEQGARTGSLIATGFLSGADAATLNRTGAILADTEFRGADASTFAETGALIADSLLAGVDASTFSELGTIMSAAMLVGADVFTAAETGSLITKPLLAGVSQKEGSGKTGALLTAAVLSGVDATTLSETGALVADTELRGVDSFSPSETGALISDTTLAGAVSKTAQKLGSLAVAVVVNGLDAREAVESGSLIADTILSGIKALEGAGKSGSLAAAAGFSGQDSEERGEAGTIAADTAFSGVGSKDFNQTGTIAPTVYIQGNDVFIATETGVVYTDASLTGSQAQVFEVAGSLYVAIRLESPGPARVGPNPPEIIVVAQLPEGTILGSGIEKPKLLGANDPDDTEITGGKLWP